MSFSEMVKSFSDLRILVVGDLLIDVYMTVSSNGYAQEAFIPKYQAHNMRRSLGGAGYVASLCAEWGADVVLWSGPPLGADTLTHPLVSTGDIANLLQRNGVEGNPNTRVSIKLRQCVDVFGSMQVVNRTDWDAHNLDQSLEDIPDPSQFDLIIVADYGKGTVHPQLMADLTTMASGIVVADPYSDSSLFAFSGVHLLKMNRRQLAEFGTVHGLASRGRELDSLEDGILALMDTLGDQDGTPSVVITKDIDGASGRFLPVGSTIDVPAVDRRRVVDVTGAGDVVLAYLGMVAASGFENEMEFKRAMELSQAAAGYAVQMFGCNPVREVLMAKQGGGELYLSFRDFVRAYAPIRDQNRLVYTNGVFDLLHPGHIQLLKQAKELGSYLLVAVADDDVAIGKGAGRPVEPWKDRAEKVGALKWVDAVIKQSPGIPNLDLREIRPDVLVKGGDYQESEVVGAKIVRDNGGEVRVLPFREGYSTTKLIEAVNNATGGNVL